MRLTQKEFLFLKTKFQECFLAEDGLWLFGSRVDDTKKGGDIDLYIETYFNTAELAYKAQIKFLVAVKTAIGDQKIDVVLRLMNSDYFTNIYDLARTTGIKII
ncbi:MAG: nucleotidyltransferase domain-containing protein [Gammaproteobacteria bacterium]